MQRYSFFVNYQNFCREKLKFYTRFNRRSQLKHRIVDVHIILLYAKRYACGGKRLSGDGRSLMSPGQISFATRSDSVRRPVGFRSPPDQIPFATQSVSVRRPVGFRTQTGEKSWRFREKNYNFMIANIRLWVLWDP